MRYQMQLEQDLARFERMEQQRAQEQWEIYQRLNQVRD